MLSWDDHEKVYNLGAYFYINWFVLFPFLYI